MTSVGPPRFDSDIDYGIAAPDAAATPRRWIVPVVLAAGALLLVARLTSTDPTPEAGPEPVPATTTLPPPPTAPADSDYAGADLVVPITAMTATRDGYFAFGENSGGELVFLQSGSGIDWGGFGDQAAISGLYAHDQAVGLWPIPGFGFLAAFDDEVASMLRFAQSSDGESWLPLASLRYKDAPLRVEFAAVSATSALISVEPVGRPDTPPDQFVLALGSGAVEPVVLDEFDRVRTAAFDIGSRALLTVVTRVADDDRSDPDRFFWFSDGIWTPAEFDDLTADAVLELGSRAGDIVALTEDRVRRYEPETGRWASSFVYGMPGHDVLDTGVGVGGVAVVTAIESGSADRMFVHVTSNMVEWRMVEIAEELTKLEIEAVGPDDAVLVAFRVGVGLRRHPPGLLVRLLSVELPEP